MGFSHEALVSKRDFLFIDPTKIVCSEFNPRTDFSGEEELMQSIIENGVVTPLKIKRVDNNLILVDGERRLRAVMKAREQGHEIMSVPCILVTKNISNVDALFTSLVSNDGKPLNPIEEAKGYQRLTNWGVAIKDIAKRMGRSLQHIQNRLELFQASPEVQKAVVNKEVKLGEAKAIVKSSKGSIEKQNETLKKKKETGEKVPAIKIMSKRTIEKTIIERKGILGFANDADKLRNEGIIIGLNMALWNSPEVKSGWI